MVNQKGLRTKPNITLILLGLFLCGINIYSPTLFRGSFIRDLLRHRRIWANKCFQYFQYFSGFRSFEVFFRILLNRSFFNKLRLSLISCELQGPDMVPLVNPSVTDTNFRLGDLIVGLYPYPIGHFRDFILSSLFFIVKVHCSTEFAKSLIKTKLNGFRAPNFAIFFLTKNTLWYISVTFARTLSANYMFMFMFMHAPADPA